MTLEDAKRELVEFVKLKTTQQPVFLSVILDAIPAADVVEVKHGEWIVDDAGSEHCSCCGHKFYISALFAVGGNNEPNCCPNCGAKMDGGENE